MARPDDPPADQRYATARRKAALRAETRARRDGIEASVRGTATRAIEARLAALPSLDTAHVVHSYVGIGSEVGTNELIRGLLMRGQRVVCPRVNDQGGLDHLEISDVDSLVDGPIGLREPDPRFAAPVALAEVDVMLVPALAFDRSGYRLGYGRGYYDHALSELRSRGGAIAEFRSHRQATTIGLAFDEQMVDELPREGHDQPVALIVTQTETIVSGSP